MFVVNSTRPCRWVCRARCASPTETGELEKPICGSAYRGQTALYDAIAKALETLQQAAGTKKVLIVVSDGGDNASRCSLAQVMRLAAQSSAIIYTIAYSTEMTGPESGNAQASGAGTVRSLLSQRLSEVVAICEGIARIFVTNTQLDTFPPI